MGIVYEDEIHSYGFAYFSVDRMEGIQYNTNVHAACRGNIFVKERA